MEVVLQLRSVNMATVKDIVDLRKFLLSVCNGVHTHVTRVEDRLRHLERSISNKSPIRLKRAECMDIPPETLAPSPDYPPESLDACSGSLLSMAESMAEILDH